MPLPTPRPEEQQSDFVSRCMGNDEMIREFPDLDQRRAVCQNQWEEGPVDYTFSRETGDSPITGSEATNVYPMAQARLGSHSSGLSRRNGVVGALSYPKVLERAWRNYGWPFDGWDE